MKKTIFFLFLFLTFVPSILIAQLLTLNSADRPPLSTGDHQGFSDQVISEAFRRIGVNVQFVALSSARALSNANNGIDDGNYLRIKGLEKRFPNLIRVPEKIIDVYFVIFSSKIDIKTEEWKSLQPYHVAFVRGWQIAERNLKDIRDTTKVENRTSLFKVLAAERVDMVFAELYGGYWVTHELGLKKIKALQPPLAKKEMFLYLNKKHAPLVPKLASALKEMKLDGSYNKIFQQALGPFIPDDYLR